MNTLRIAFLLFRKGGIRPAAGYLKRLGILALAAQLDMLTALLQLLRARLLRKKP